MGWIKDLFTNREEKDQVNKLVIIATAENIIDHSDVLLLKEDMNYITIDSEFSSSDEIRKSLPKSSKERFALVYFLITTIMANGALSDKKLNIIAHLLSALNLSSEKALELTSFLKLNIRNGLSEEDSFQRLGYLVA